MGFRPGLQQASGHSAGAASRRSHHVAKPHHPKYGPSQILQCGEVASKQLRLLVQTLVEAQQPYSPSQRFLLRFDDEAQPCCFLLVGLELSVFYGGLSSSSTLFRLSTSSSSANLTVSRCEG